jgi:RNA polymerase-binding protein DksA
MTDTTDYADLENDLRQTRERLRGEIEQRLLDSEANAYEDIAHRVHDAGEASVSDLLKGLEFDRIQNESREIEAVEHALTKFDNNQYGICEDCGTQIRIERLRAEPTATRCINCQQKHETEFEEGARSTHSL